MTFMRLPTKITIKKAFSLLLLFLGFGVSILFFQNCAKGGFEAAGEGEFGLASLSAPCEFGGRLIAAGNSVEAFSSATVRHGITCNAVKEKRSCSAGALSGSFTSDSCLIDMATSPICSLNGVPYAEGQSVTMYQANLVNSGQSCAPETRTCRNGTMTGSYTASACQVASAGACTVQGKLIANGASITAYPAATVPVGQKCQDSQRVLTCVNGSVAGIESYPHLECRGLEVSANTRCQISAPYCPYMPGSEGTWWTDRNTSTVLGTSFQKDRQTCLSAVSLSTSCDASGKPAVSATFFVNGAAVAKKIQGYYCQIENPTCPHSPENVGSFRDTDELATVNQAACLARSEYWKKTCGSVKSTATFIEAAGAGLIMLGQKSYP